MKDTLIIGSIGILILLVLTEAVMINNLLSKMRRQSTAASIPVELFRSSQEDVTEEEIINMVQEGHEQGIIEKSEAEMISNIFAFDDKEAKDIMTHRSNICFLDGETAFLDAVGEMIESGRSRIPVFLENPDNVIGILHIKDVLAYSLKRELIRKPIHQIEGLIRPCTFIPETLNINSLFHKMQKNRSHLVMVVDEYGQISGIVAMEDILEEIVGNIEDEHDTEEKHITKQTNGVLLIEGLTDFAEVVEALGLAIDPEEYETLNGFLIDQLEHIPSPDEAASVSYGNYSFKIKEVSNQIIQKVEVTEVLASAEKQ